MPSILTRPIGGGGGVTTAEIGVYSDAGLTTPIVSADFGDTVYINITTSIASPTEYRFLIFESSIIGNYTLQAGATLAYTITSFNDLLIFAEAEDGSAIAAALTPFNLSINADADATVFIAAHNAASGQTMASAQQEVNQTFVQMLKGSGTTFGSNLYSKIKELYLFCPVDDTTVSIPAYAIDLIDPSTPATWAGFVTGDYAVTGVTNSTGSSAKFLQMKKAPSDFPQNSHSLHAYNRSATEAGSRWIMGSVNGTNYSMLGAGGSDSIASGVNSSSFPTSPANNLLGFISANRTSSTSIDFYRNGSLLNLASATSLTPNTLTYKGFQLNGVSASAWTKELSMLMLAEGFTANEMADLNEAVAYYQTNIITGGRNV